MKEFLIIFLFLILTVMLQGCIHTYTDESEGDSAKIIVHLNIKMNNAFSEKLEYFTYEKEYYSTNGGDVTTRSEGEADYVLTLEIIDQDNKSIHLSRTLGVGVVEESGETVTLPVALDAGKYDILMWCQQCKEGDVNNSIDNLHAVDLQLSHGDAGLIPVCGFAHLELDLSGYAGTTTTDVSLEATLINPIARIRFVTTDVEEFIHSQNGAIVSGEKYSMSVGYVTSTPSAFSVAKESPTSYLTALTFRKEMPMLFSQHVTLFTDWILAEDESKVEMQLTVYNSAQMPVSRISSIPVTVRRGCMTTVRGDFLTNFSQHTITVDNIWSDDIIVDL